MLEDKWIHEFSKLGMGLLYFALHKNALTAAAAPAMKIMTGKTNQLDRGSTWIPVLNGWLASRNLDTMSSKKFRSWFAEHKKQVEEQKRVETAQALTDACRNNANREEN